MVAGQNVRKLTVTLFDSALDLSRQDALSIKKLGRMIASEPRIGMVSARVEIHRRVALLGPGMDGQMRFGKDDRAGYALGFESMKRALHNGGACGLGRTDHHCMDAVDIRKQHRVTAREFAHNVPSECFQFSR